MNEHEIARLAAALHQARPDWPTKQLVTLMSDSRMVDRPRRDVFVALAWVACETSSASPYRVLEAGPWWRAAAVDGGQTHVRDVAPVGTRCTTCGRREGECPADHEFTPPHERAVDITPVIAELKGLARPDREQVTEMDEMGADA